ncbi:MAG: DUF2007 domain-containing protein [Deltaproteobacteria bacterium]|nr:DUF2007 domain-containing protein [Deltaproteobacteria bacterium]
MANDDDIEWVALRVTRSRAEAEMLGELLAQEGIRTSVEGALSAGVLPGVEQVRVMVPKDRLDDAEKAARAFGE